MTTLTPTEAAILEQLREKPMQPHHMTLDCLASDIWPAFMRFKAFDFIHVSRYVQQWRTVGEMTILHLTHEGRLALIAHEAGLG